MINLKKQKTGIILRKWSDPFLLRDFNNAESVFIGLRDITIQTDDQVFTASFWPFSSGLEHV